MTPKEKAKELFNKFYGATPSRKNIIKIAQDRKFAIQCALIAVDEILINFGNLTDGKPHYCSYSTVKFYREVRQEIQKL